MDVVYAIKGLPQDPLSGQNLRVIDIERIQEPSLVVITRLRNIRVPMKGVTIPNLRDQRVMMPLENP